MLDELQDGPGFSILSGIERPQARERLTPERIAAAVSGLQERFAVVLIDGGETLSGVTSAVGAAFLRSAERVLLVVPPEAVSAVVNRLNRRDQYGEHEVERALGIRVVAAIPDDPRAARRARANQVPITAAGGRAARALADLATRLSGVPEIEEQASADEPSTWRRWRRQPAEGRR